MISKYSEPQLRGLKSSKGPILCNLFSTHHIPLPGQSEIDPSLRCVTDDGRSISITNIPLDFKLEMFQSGKTRLSVLRKGIKTEVSVVSDGVVSKHEVIDMTLGLGSIILYNNKTDTERFIDQKYDNFILAVIRVTDIVGHSPSKTGDEISDNIFGTGSDSFNIVSGNDFAKYS